MNINCRTILKENPGEKSRGFTLIEVLIAMVILMVGLLAMASMQIMAMKGNQHANVTTQRTTAANYYMEWLMALDYDHNNLRDLIPDSTVYDHPNTGNADVVLDNLPGITDYLWRVENVGTDDDSSGTIEAGEADAKLITVKVFWEDGGETSLANRKEWRDE